MKKVILFISLILKGLHIYACTDFLLSAEDGSIVVGRSMEFATHVNSEITIHPRGEKRVSSAPDHQKGLSWISRYGYLSINSLGTIQATDGMNEAGLSFGFLWMPDTQYPEFEKEDPHLLMSILDLGDWVLGNFATVEQVCAALQHIRIWPEKLPQLQQTPPLHISIHDKEGKSLAIEFIDGAMAIIDNPAGILTNSPKLEWHLINLRNYLNLSAFNAPSRTMDGSVLNPTGQGSGLLGMPGDWTPPSRFVRIALLKAWVEKPPAAKEAVNLAFHLLNNVDIPYGIIRSSDGKEFDYTQWCAVKDLTSGILYYRTYRDLRIHSLHLHQELQKSARIKKIPMHNADYPPKRQE